MQYLVLALHGLTLGAIYALVALGFHLVFRAAGLLDFAQGEKVVLSTLLALSLVQSGIPLPVAALLVVAIGFVLGIGYDRAVIAATVRRGVLPAVIATVGAFMVLESSHILVWGDQGRPFPSLVGGEVGVGQATIQAQSFLILGIVALIVVALASFLSRTRLGLGVSAASEDALAAATLGIDSRRVRMLAFGIAFALTGLAGFLVAPFTLAGGAVGVDLTVKGFTAAILGGLGSTYGVVGGALLLGLFRDLVGSQVSQSVREPMVYLILIVALLLRPNGLFARRRVRMV